uniref:Uncharacterized protein n=1 Tax=Graphocephala atropunctata TaxID=36148 RepID=A0A1B6MQV7_9HEMI
MSLVNHFQVLGTENISNKLTEVKKFGASVSQSEVKKKALADVGNTLHQKSVQRVSKASAAVSKQNIVGKNLLNIFSREANKNLEKNKSEQVDKIQGLLLREMNSEMEYLDEANVEPVCFCNENCEDGMEDFMLKHIKLTKAQIDDLALTWENPSAIGPRDKYEIEIKFPKAPEMNCSSFTIDNLMKDMLDFEYDVSKLPEPASPYDFILEEDQPRLSNGYNCYGI